MENTINKEMFAEAIKANGAKMNELYKAYEVAKLGYEVQQQEEKDIIEEILYNHPFYSSEDMECFGHHKGDRVMKEEHMYLLSEEDHKAFWVIANPIFNEKGVTDEKGYYKIDWLGLEVASKQELVNFIIDNIIPQPVRADFEAARKNVVWQDKLMDIFFKNA